MAKNKKPTAIVPTNTHVDKFLTDLSDDENQVVDLTDKQQQVFKLKLRGFSQAAIGKVMDISQPAVAKHWKAIKRRFEAAGASIDQNQVVGESTHLFQEIEQRGWDLYHTAKAAKKLGDANRALATIMAARDKSLHLLMDLGLLRRAAVEYEHSVTVSPLVAEWRSGDAQKKLDVTCKVIGTQLDSLEDPQPDEYVDAEFLALDELDEPVPDSE